MLTSFALLVVFPSLVLSSGEGNIHLLEDEVATALRACSYHESAFPKRNYRSNHRRQRSNNYDYQEIQLPRIDIGAKRDNVNIYGHERRNSTVEMYVLNGAKNCNNTPRIGTNTSFKYVGVATVPSGTANRTFKNRTRSRRSGSLINKSNHDQCLSQCVFANLHVVDRKGVPREDELWKKVQTGVISQQSRTMLRKQIRACFQELQLEDEDDGCSYSNKLENCLMLHFSDRKYSNKTYKP